jgi:hypothetical protein
MNQVLGWLLNEGEREDLLRRFRPIYPDVVAHQVTLQAKAPAGAPLPCETTGEIVGETDDGRDVQALVVRIGGTTDRPYGSTYHVTWTLDRSRGRKPVESNDVIREHG